MSKKPSIGNRRKSAMSAQVDETPAPLETPQATPEAETSAPKPPAKAAVAPAKTKGEERPTRPKAAPKTSTATDVTRQGIYLTTEEFEAAKSGYLADWQKGGQADTFAKWIGAALEAHATRSASDRALLERHGDRAETRTGSSRSFNIATDTIERMRAAIIEDQAAGRWPSSSAWCGDAIAAAVDRARAAFGAELPPPPKRLPNRLWR